MSYLNVPWSITWHVALNRAGLIGHLIIVTCSSKERLQTKLETLYRVIQKDRSMFFEVIVLDIVKNFHMIKCKILSGHREREERERMSAVWMKQRQGIVNGKNLIEITA